MSLLKTLFTGAAIYLLITTSCTDPLDENANAVAADKSALAIIYAAGDNANSVTKDVGLPASGASGTTISWFSSKNGVITIYGEVLRPDSISGDAAVKMTATISKGTASDVKVFVLLVLAKGTRIPVTGVSVKTATTVQAGTTEQLTATIVPGNATNKGVTWSSATVPVATVTSSGLVTGLAEGTSVVTVTTVDGNFSGQCLVTVTKSIIVEGTVTDIDGNVYKTVKIGNQEWMAENLRVTRYNDGSAITKITSDVTWDSCYYTYTPAYCYYNNTTNTDSIKKWGTLYNWYVVAPTNPKKIAPAGWHLPTDAEWTILEKHLVLNGYNWDGTTDTSAYNKIAKSLASKTDWYSSTSPGAIGNDLTTNNRSGFSALPGGSRDYGTFHNQSENGYWWSATEYFVSFAYTRYLYYYLEYLGRYYYGKQNGFSVRLLRD